MSVKTDNQKVDLDPEKKIIRKIFFYTKEI